MNLHNIQTNGAEHRGLVLIVEDDTAFRRLLAGAIQKLGFDVREAENGMVAKSVFDSNRQNLILIFSDIKMPEVDGIELLKHIRAQSQIPFILMTGFSEILESVDAASLGANHFLPKPFRMEALITAIDACVNAKQPERTESEKGQPVESDFCKIHISEFITSSRLISDLYVRLANKKFVKIAHKGDAIPIDRLKIYQEKKVDFLYVAIKDFALYVNFNIQIAHNASRSKAISPEKKLKLLSHTAEVIVEKCFLGDIDKDLLLPAKQTVEDTLRVVSEDSDILDLLLTLDSHSNRLYAHSVAVSLFSSLIARQHGWHSTTTLFKVSLSGLMHDIGKKEIPVELIEKRRASLTHAEIKVLESHTVRGRDILLSVRSLPEEITQIVAQHHENRYGSGYPFGLKFEQIHPLAKLLAVANQFINLVLPLNEGDESLTPQAAIEKMETVYAEELDATFLRRLKEILEPAVSRPNLTKAV